MERLLLNLVLLSFFFAFLGARNRERISLGIAWRLFAGGAIMLGLAGLLGKAFGHSISETYLDLTRSNDVAMGVILGIGFLYAGALCLVWVIGSRRTGAT